MLVSVIIPAYNASKHLGFAIESVLMQSYSDLEIIIIDDGSTDSTLDIAMQYCKLDKRFYVLQHDNGANKGVSATRNLGIKRSRGEYIALLDADDLWHKTKIEKQLRVFDENRNVQLVYSQLETLFETDLNYAFPSICGSGSEGIQLGIFTEMVNDQIWIPNSSVIFRREILDRVGFFKEGLKYQVEDHLFFTKTTYFFTTFYLREITGTYRIHSGSYTANNKWQKSFYEFLVELIKDRDIRNKGIIFNALIVRLKKDLLKCLSV
jgi:glycosyltransferase involved in cell wall biosynthesis